MVLAHIAGIPVEETALSFGPVLAATGGIAVMKIRERTRAGRRRPDDLRKGGGRSRRKSI
jgi:hypothetical protein